MFNKYTGVYICETEKDSLECQKHFNKKGYKWYNGDDIRHFEHDKIVIYLKDDMSFGWSFYKSLIEKDYLYRQIIHLLKPWVSRKDKIKRLLG